MSVHKNSSVHSLASEEYMHFGSIVSFSWPFGGVIFGGKLLKNPVIASWA